MTPRFFALRACESSVGTSFGGGVGLAIDASIKYAEMTLESMSRLLSVKCGFMAYAGVLGEGERAGHSVRGDESRESGSASYHMWLICVIVDSKDDLPKRIST